MYTVHSYIIAIVVYLYIAHTHTPPSACPHTSPLCVPGLALHTDPAIRTDLSSACSVLPSLIAPLSPVLRYSYARIDASYHCSYVIPTQELMLHICAPICYYYGRIDHALSSLNASCLCSYVIPTQD